MEKITLEEFLERLKNQKVDKREDYAFKCPMCGTIQSAKDLIKAGAGKDFDEVEKFLGFSCIGRFTGKGTPPSRLKRDYQGCNWTLGGLFQCHELEVTTPDGEKHARFEPATPEEAQRHSKH